MGVTGGPRGVLGVLGGVLEELLAVWGKGGGWGWSESSWGDLRWMVGGG